MGEHDQERPVLGTAEKAKLVATAVVCLVLGLAVFYETVPAIHGGYENASGQWHTFVLPPNRWATDRFGNRAFIDKDHNSISVMEINTNWSPVLPHVPEVQAADGTMVVTLRDGSSATFPIGDGFAKHFLVGAPVDVNLVTRPLAVYDDPGNRPRLAAILSQYKTEAPQPQSKGVPMSEILHSIESGRTVSH